MPFQEQLDEPVNREQPYGNRAVDTSMATLGEGISNTISSVSKLFEITNKNNATDAKTQAVSSYSKEMNRLFQAKQQGAISDRAFRAGVAQKHVEMSNTYQGVYTEDFLKEQQNLFGYNVVGSALDSGKSQEEQANEMANKLKAAALEGYQKNNPDFNLANNPDFLDNGVFNVDRAYNFVAKSTQLTQQINENNPNAVVQKFTLEASPLLATLRDKTNMFANMQAQEGSSAQSLKIQQELGTIQQELANTLEQRRINTLAQLPINTSKETREALDRSMKDIIESSKAIVPYMNETFEKNRKAMEDTLGMDGLQAGHMLRTLKEAGIADEVLSNIVQQRVSGDAKLQTQIYNTLDQAVQGIVNKNDVRAVQTLTALRDWTKDPSKSIMEYDAATRQTLTASALANMKALSTKNNLNSQEQKGWYDTSVKIPSLAGSATSGQELKNLNAWFALPKWREQFDKLAPTLGKEKSNLLADNVRAMQIQAFKEYAITLSQTDFTFKEVMPGTLNPGFLTLGTNESQRQVQMSTDVKVQPYYNALTGLVEIDPRVRLDKDQQQMLNTLNQSLTTFASLNQYDEASVQNNLTGLAARELVARGLLNVEVKGNSSLPKGAQDEPIMDENSLASYFEAIQTKSQKDNFLTSLNQFRQQVNAFGSNVRSDSYNLSSPIGGANDQGAMGDVTLQEDAMSLLDIPGDLTVDSIKGTVAEEGLRLRVYRDTVGKRTVGIGFNMDSPGARQFWKESGVTLNYDDVLAGKRTLTEDDAIKLFNVTKKHAYDNASKLVSNWSQIGANRQAALADMVFQMGVQGVKGFKTTLKLINEGDFQGAARQMMQSRWARQTPARAARVAEMLAANEDRFTVNNRLVSQGRISKRSSIS